jgi:hypothetical protein
MYSEIKIFCKEYLFASFIRKIPCICINKSTNFYFKYEKYKLEIVKKQFFGFLPPAKVPKFQKFF